MIAESEESGSETTIVVTLRLGASASTGESIIQSQMATKTKCRLLDDVSRTSLAAR